MRWLKKKIVGVIESVMWIVSEALDAILHPRSK